MRLMIKYWPFDSFVKKILFNAKLIKIMQNYKKNFINKLIGKKTKNKCCLSCYTRSKLNFINPLCKLI